WLPKTPIGWLWWLVMGLGGVSTLFSVTPAQSVFGWLAGLGYAITFIVATWTVNTPGRLKQLMRAIFWLAGAMSVFGLAVYAANLYIHWHFSPELEIVIGTPDRRINSVMYHPNLLAGYLVLALACGLSLFHQVASWPRKIVYGLGLATVGTCLFFTASRAGWIGGAVLLFSFGLLVDRRWLLALLGAAASAFAFAPQLVISRLSALSVDNPAFDKYRLLAWQSAQQMLWERPLTGWGPGTWGTVYPQFRLAEETRHLPHAHNYFLHVGVEFGIPVVIALFTLVFWVLLRGAKATRRTQYHLPVLAVICGVAGYLTMNLFDYTLSEGRNAMAFFLLVGGVEAARRMAIADRPPELTKIIPAAPHPAPEEPR
ncbi:MAG: O-antigen ligase family protein, partial [Candidatus Sericytochromatia bacterium]